MEFCFNSILGHSLILLTHLQREITKNISQNLFLARIFAHICATSVVQCPHPQESFVTNKGKKTEGKKERTERQIINNNFRVKCMMTHSERL